jgi:AhpD family alkylhydroperoxidase
MSDRLNYAELSKSMVRKLYELSAETKHGAIDAGVAGLAKIRASQINGCAFCVDMHIKEATLRGERPLRLHHVAIFRDSPLFTEREKVALLWAEALTRLAEGGVSDALYERARAQFSEKELSDLTIIVATTNLWNRLQVAFCVSPGSWDGQLGLLESGLS